MSSKKKIAILMNAFWNNGAGTSGGDQRIVQIFKRISDDFAIDIYTSKDGSDILKNNIKAAKIIVSAEKLNRGNLIIIYFKRTLWALKKILAKKYDVVYSSSDFLPDVIPCFLYLKKKPDVKWIQCIFHYYPDWQTRSGNKFMNLIATIAQKLSFRLIKNRATRIININYQVRDNLVSLGFLKKKIAINPCGVDLDLMNSIKVLKRNLQVSFLGRLNPSKGIFDLPQIWKSVVKEIPNAQLKIIGGGSRENQKKLAKMITDNQLWKNIELCGFLPNDQAFKIVKSSQLFIFPSHEEGFGMAIAEAMACGLPVVAWGLPIYSEVFPTGLIQVKEEDTEGFARQVINILSNKNKLLEYGEKAVTMVQKYGWDMIAESERKIIFSTLQQL